MNFISKASAVFVLGIMSLAAYAQPGDFQKLDGIIAVVGDEIILQSELEARLIQEQMSGGTIGPNKGCELLEEMLFEKLLLHNARIDSLVVSDMEVMDEIDRRLAYYIEMLGSIEAFEAEYGKSVAQWKDDFGKPIKNQLLAQKMQGSINKQVRSTPAEIIEFFEEAPKDSLPLIPEEISYSELVIQPEITVQQKRAVETKLDSIRDLVAEGKMSMTLAATRYSEDPGSKYKGGCYKNIGRGQFVPEFEEAVFDTPVGAYSEVFETDFGYHFLRVTDKRGEQFSACHVLMKPKIDPLALEKNGVKIDSVYQKLSSGKMSFEHAVLEYSTKTSSANQKGQVVNNRDGGVRFGVDELETSIYFMLDALEIEGFSEPVNLVDADGNGYWAIFKLNARHPAHRANPSDDYSLFQSQVENIKRQKAMSDWVEEHLEEAYIRLHEDLQNCQFDMNWKKDE